LPYNWLPPSPQGETELRLWPHRSLTARGFVGFIAVTAILAAVPLIGLIGKPALWAMLPFGLAALAAIWMALRKSERDREILEVLTLSKSSATLTRTGPRGAVQNWEANPHWVQPVLHPTGTALPNYLTLRGGPREVEIGGFLTEEERLSLYHELQTALGNFR
jgi:uncharacterized membrane protein